MALEDLDRIKNEISYENPVTPTEQSNDDEFQIDCLSSEGSLQVFDMCSYDIDSFEKFVKPGNFNNLLKHDEKNRQESENDQEALFGEMSIEMNDNAIEQRVESRKERKAQHELEKADQKWPQRKEDFSNLVTIYHG